MPSVENIGRACPNVGGEHRYPPGLHHGRRRSVVDPFVYALSRFLHGSNSVGFPSFFSNCVLTPNKVNT
jgi:hypothetical protein